MNECILDVDASLGALLAIEGRVETLMWIARFVSPLFEVVQDRIQSKIRDIPIFAALYLQGRLNLDDLVSKRIALRDVNEGYAALKEGSVNRIVVTSF